MNPFLKSMVMLVLILIPIVIMNWLVIPKWFRMIMNKKSLQKIEK